jgi:hypothetical protein
VRGAQALRAEKLGGGAVQFGESVCPVVGWRFPRSGRCAAGNRAAIAALIDSRSNPGRFSNRGDRLMSATATNWLELVGRLREEGEFQAIVAFDEAASAVKVSLPLRGG